MTDLTKNERIKKRIEQEKEIKKVKISRLLKTLIVIIVLLVVVWQFDKIKAWLEYSWTQIKNISIFVQWKITELTEKKEIIQTPIVETWATIENSWVTNTWVINNSGILDNSWTLVSTWEILTQTWLSDSWAIQTNTWEIIKEEIKKEEPKKIVPKITRIKDVYNFQNYIWFWNTGKDVTKLQNLLKKYGYYNWEIDWYYSEALWDSLAHFIQAKTGTSISYKQLWPQAIKILNNIVIK